MKTRLSLLAALGGGLLLVACATPVNRNLQQAQADYAAAANDPQVRSLAPTALHDAQVALERAEQAQGESRSREEVDHLAYLSSRRAEIARVSAQRNANVAAAPPVVVVERKVETVETVPVVPRTATLAESRVEVLATELAAALQDLRTRRGERGLVVSVEDVLFEPERATLHADALADLARLADFLHAHPELEVQIEGHSDLSESDQLSIARARAVESYLVMRGVEATRITTVAHGDHDPIASSTTAVGRQQNRRVEIVLLD
jgi:outer membrane protein OmpA-like peptidoglycan-associated protein